MEKLHVQYVAALRACFEKYKHGAGYGDRELEVVEAKGGHGGKSSSKEKSNYTTSSPSGKKPRAKKLD